MSIKAIKLGLVALTRQLLPTQLSTIPAGGNTTKPAVILNRAGSDKPKFPYAVVDFISSSSLGYSITNSYYEDSKQIDEYHSVGTFMVQVNGGIKDDPLTMASTLRNVLLTSKGVELFEASLPNCGLVSISQPAFFPSFMSTDYEEAARLIIEISFSTLVEDSTTTTIDSIDLDGEIYNDFLKEDAPLSINTIAP